MGTAGGIHFEGVPEGAVVGGFRGGTLTPQKDDIYIFIYIYIYTHIYI